MDTAVPPAATIQLSSSPRAIRKRERKLALRRIAEEKRFDRKALVSPSIVRTVLTDRDQALLREQTDRLFNEGKIDIRFMGTRFLELHRQGWTPPFIEHFLEASNLKPKELLKWTDAQFEQVWEWWQTLHPKARDSVLETSCEMSKPASAPCKGASPVTAYQ